MCGTTALPYGWVSCPVFSGATLFGEWATSSHLLNGLLLPTPQSSICHERTYRKQAWGLLPCVAQQHCRRPGCVVPCFEGQLCSEALGVGYFFTLCSMDIFCPPRNPPFAMGEPPLAMSETTIVHYPPWLALEMDDRGR